MYPIPNDATTLVGIPSSLRTGRGMLVRVALRTDGEANCGRIGEVAARGGDRDGVGASGRPGGVRRKDPGAAARGPA